MRQYRFLRTAVVAAAGLAASALPVLTYAASGGYISSFAGAPAVPSPYSIDGWDQFVHQRDDIRGDEFVPVTTAHHGPGCTPYPAAHVAQTYADAIYQCKNHIMTSLDSGMDHYSVLYLTPNQLLDWSQGEAVVRFNVSTLRTSTRDWLDVWVTPYDEHTQMPLDLTGPQPLPDGQGEPRDTVHITGRNTGVGLTGLQTVYEAVTYHNWVATSVNGATDPRGRLGVEDALASAGLKPDASRRETFELRLSRNHIKFGLPAYNYWFVDQAVSDIGFSQGVVQFGQHSYSPTGKCSTPIDLCSAPNTWHWSDISFSSSVPFTILRASDRLVNAASPVVHFPQPAPSGSVVKYETSGTNPRLSFDNGASWVRPQLARTAQVHNTGQPDWTHPTLWEAAVPEGTSRILVASDPGFGDTWYARNFAVYSLASNGVPTTSPTSVPTTSPTSVPTASPSASPTPAPTSPTITFEGLSPVNTSFSGVYPTNLIDWGTGAWYLSGPWRALTGNSVSFAGATQSSGSFTFVSPRRLVQVDAFNGDSADGVVTLACGGQPTVQVSLAPGETRTLATNWTGACTTVTLSTSNGWNTNFTNFVVATR